MSRSDLFNYLIRVAFATPCGDNQQGPALSRDDLDDTALADIALLVALCKLEWSKGGDEGKENE